MGPKSPATFSILAPPSSDETKRLASNFLEQDRYRRDQGRTDCTVRSADRYENLIAGVNGARSVRCLRLEEDEQMLTDSLQHNGVCGILKKLNLESQKLLPMSLFTESYELSEPGSTSVFYIRGLQVSTFGFSDRPD